MIGKENSKPLSLIATDVYKTSILIREYENKKLPINTIITSAYARVD